MKVQKYYSVDAHIIDEHARTRNLRAKGMYRREGESRVYTNVTKRLSKGC